MKQHTGKAQDPSTSQHVWNTSKCKSNHRLKFVSSQFDWPKGNNSRIKKNNNNNQPMGVIFNKNTQLRRKFWPVPVYMQSPRRAAAATL